MASHRLARSEDGTIDALRKFVSKWGLLLTICGAAVGIFYEHKRGVDDLAAAVRRLREDCDARDRRYVSAHAFGDSGFSDPTIRAALDNHLRQFLQSYNAVVKADVDKWRRLFFQLNPSIQQPSE